MKKTIPSFLNTLSDDDFDILEDIFINKYTKFTYIYWLIKDYASKISELTYRESDNTTLKIDMVIQKLAPEKVMNDISERASDTKNLLLYNNGDVIHIEVTD